MKEFIAILPGLIMVIFASWYAYKIYRGIIKPALSTWLIMMLSVTLSIITYLISSGFNYLGAALNFGDVLTGIIILSTILLTQKFSLRFRPFEKWYLMASGVMVVFWILSHNAFVSNLLIQVLLIISYLPTIQKFIAEKKNTESLSAWSISLSASMVSLFSSFASGNILSIIYVFRSIVMTGIVMSLVIYFDYCYKRPLFRH